MELEEEVLIPSFYNALVNNGAALGIRRVVCVFFSSWIKSSVITFTNDNNGHSGKPLFGIAWWIDFFARLAEKR
jgi:uncharacterized membrane protein YGL010W